MRELAPEPVEPRRNPVDTPHVKLLPLLCTATLLLGASGCLTEVSHSPAPAPEAPPTISLPSRAWDVVGCSRVAGVVIEFSERDGERRFFSVRNVEQQELGMVDAYGRAWRFLPHDEESEWLGTGTIAEGTGRILGLEGSVELIEIDLGMLLDEAALSSTRGE